MTNEQAISVLNAFQAEMQGKADALALALKLLRDGYQSDMQQQDIAAKLTATEATLNSVKDTLSQLTMQSSAQAASSDTAVQ